MHSWFPFNLVFVPLLSLLFLDSTTRSSAESPDLNDPGVQKQVDALVMPFIDSKRVKGMSIGLITGGTTKAFHYGKTSGREGKPSDATLYEIGSVSKVFTGLLLADAVISSEVKLEQSAEDLLPDGAKMPSFDGSKISLLQMSIHRSGLPRLPSNMTNVGGDNPYANYTSERAIDFLKTHPLRRKPGEKGEYSNFAVSLLGNLICRRSGKTYDQLLSERITGPLNMTDTTVTANTAALKRLATGHDTSGNPVSTWEFADMPGAGGIRSTVPDMIRFASANLNPPDGDLGKAIDLAWKQHHPGNAKEFAMGLGWHIAGDRQTRWHNGQTGGYHATLMVNRDLRAAVVLLTNTASMEVDALAQDLVLFLAGAPVEPKKFKEGIDVPVATMNRYVGRYQLIPNVVFDVKVVENRLMVQLTGQPAFQVFPTSETEWFYKVVPASLTFKKGKNGSFDELELFQNGARQKAKRIKK